MSMRPAPRGQWDLGNIVAAFSSAGLDSSKWPEALDVISRETESVGALMLPISSAGIFPPIPYNPAIEEVIEPYFARDWVSHDIRRRAVPKLLKTGVISEFDYTTKEEIARHPFFQDYLCRYGLTWSGIVLMASGEDAWCVSVQRGRDQYPFSPAELEKLRSLSQHLSAAVATARAIGFARADGAMEGFEQSNRAMFMLDRFGRAVRFNKGAERLIGNGINLVAGELRFADAASNKSYQTWLYKVIRGYAAASPQIAITRPIARPLALIISRNSIVTIDSFSPVQAIVTVLDPELRLLPRIAELRLCFGLTEAEARIAVHLASGASLECAASGFGIAYSTARNQLASVMAKAGVSRQAELVAMLVAMGTPGYS